MPVVCLLMSACFSTNSLDSVYLLTASVRFVYLLILFVNLSNIFHFHLSVGLVVYLWLSYLEYLVS